MHAGGPAPLVAANLAVVLARTDQTVGLLDVDPSARGRAAAMLGATGPAGLSNALVNRAPLDRVLQQTAFVGLTALGPGPHAEDCAERFVSDGMRGVLDGLRRLHRWLVVPVDDVSRADGQALVASADAVVLVVEVGVATGEEVSGALAEIERLDVPVLGVVTVTDGGASSQPAAPSRRCPPPCPQRSRLAETRIQSSSRADQVSASGPDERDRVARGGALNLLGAAANGVSQLALVLIVTNTFSRPVAGAFFAATSAFLVAQALAELGASTGTVRWIPAYLATGRVGDVRTCLQVALVSVVSAGLVLAVALLAAAPTVGAYVADGGDQEAMTAALRILALFLPVAAVYEVMLAGTRGFSSMRQSVVIDKVMRMPAAGARGGCGGAARRRPCGPCARLVAPLPARRRRRGLAAPPAGAIARSHRRRRRATVARGSRCASGCCWSRSVSSHQARS